MINSPPQQHDFAPFLVMMIGWIIVCSGMFWHMKQRWDYKNSAFYRELYFGEIKAGTTLEKK